MPENIITQIKVKTDDVISEESIPIGTSANYVDYEGSSLQNILGTGLDPNHPIKEQLDELHATVQENKNTIQEMNQSYGTAKKIINKMDALSQQITDIQNNTADEITHQLNQRIFTTNDIRYQINSNKTLQQTLGNLINFPLNALNFRDCLEKIVNRLGGEGGEGGGSNSLTWSSIDQQNKPIHFANEEYFNSDGEHINQQQPQSINNENKISWGNNVVIFGPYYDLTITPEMWGDEEFHESIRESIVCNSLINNICFGLYRLNSN